MNDDRQIPAATAKRWYGTHGAEHLAHDHERMIDRCAQHLVTTHGLPLAHAQEVAMHAHSDLEPQDGGFIDLDRSNARSVIVNDTERGTRHVFSIARLLALTRASPQPD